MLKNTASQNIAAQLINKADGTPITTGTVTVYITIDGGTQNAGAGTISHKGNGSWNYAPTQGETNGDHLAFTFTHTDAVNVTLNVYPTTITEAAIQSAAAAALTAYDPPTKAEIDSGFAGLNDISPAEVNAEIVDVLKIDTIPELPTGAPADEPTFATAIMLWYMSQINDTQATRNGTKERRIKNAAGTTIAKATTTDDGNIFSQGKLGAP